ncbi:MAG: hypothetical protein IKC11_05080 [Clostridia bacterium]|nr:hypothetical protein [Clostridia bacterium]
MIKKIKLPPIPHRCSSMLEITDNQGNVFSMEIGGNTDLYWTARGRDSKFNFEIDKTDDFYNILDNLFDEIKKVDNQYYKTLEDNTFSWISEDRPKEEANNLEIQRLKDRFVITFNKNPSNFYPMCTVCFCNSGSYHPNVEILFMEMFNNLTNEIEEEPASE